MSVWKPFVECNSIFRALAATFSLLIVLGSVCNLVLSWKQKKERFFVGAVVTGSMGAFLFQACRAVSDLQMQSEIFGERQIVSYEGIIGLGYLAEFEDISALASATWLFALPAIVWVAGLSVLVGLSAWLLRANLKWRERHITPLSIQESFEKLTEGLCYYRAGGQCILVNGRMHDVCRELTGHMLLNGEEFEENILGVRQKEMVALGGSECGESIDEIGMERGLKEAGVIMPLKNGVVQAFSARQIEYHGEMLREIIATDVTDLYAKTLRLKEKNDRLKAFLQELQEYNDNIQDTVRREEILRAKMDIHDEMNRLLLFSRNAAAMGSEEEKRKALLAWKSNALLLCKETEGAQMAGGVATDALRDLGAIARSMGTKLVCVGNLEHASQQAVKLFVLATREALNNAVKHAGARHLFVSVEEDAKGMTVTYSNDHAESEEQGSLGTQEKNEGQQRKSEKQGNGIEAGGLKNLRQKLEEAGGVMEVRSEPEFRLVIWIPYG